MVQLPEESVLSGIVLSESATGGNSSNVVLAFLSLVARARPNTPIISFLDELRQGQVGSVYLAVLDAESYLQDTHLFEWIGRPLIRLEDLMFGQVLPIIEGDVYELTADICINLPAGYAHAKSSKIIIQPVLPGP
ncbi:unnamed protein product [Rhizoctonia solani]|uniref:Uncharacterized protein n=1 Tax=Rhizoctonia solani TaxID=456999 RepID=A0A8H2XGK7_9AGAM|nr:unnamed protein product [Rhizoctonia solani]